MSAIDAFLSTWSSARSTYGEGTPQTGAQYDNSSTLRGLQTNLESAAAGSRWTGTAASNYDAANTEHRRVIGQLADLDRRLAAEVDNSAQSVDAGRRNLETLRRWVVDAASSVPPGKGGEQLRLAIAQKGLAQLQEIVRQTNTESNAIGRRIGALESEFQALGNQRFAPKQGGGADEGLEEGDDDGEKPDDQDVEEQAAEDVRRTLEDGDQQAAARVNQVLSAITPGQDLTPEQKAYLDQMAAQQADMSVDDLKVAQDRLGDHKNVIGDSWQLISNDDVRFGEPDENGNLRPGSWDRLPESVQRAIGIYNLDYPATEVERRQIEDIADIVRNGDVKFQDGTELDREMIRLSDRLMDQSPVNEKTVRELFTSAGRDHQVVTDHMVGWQPHSDDPTRTGWDYDSDDFLDDIMHTSWGDDGKDAASLFSWTNEAATGPDSDIASAAAERYAQYLGSHKDQLLDLPNGFFQTDTLGQVNPELVKGMAHGLTPYMADIAGVEGGAADNFGPLDGGDQTRPLAKGVFAVLGTDVDAYREFYGAADELALQKSFDWANDVKQGNEVFQHDARMNAAATLKGLIDHGTAEGMKTIGLDNNEMTDLKKSVYNHAVSALSAAGGPYGKAIGIFGGLLEESFFGNGSDISGDVKPMFADESARFATNALLAAGVEIPGAEKYLVWDTDANGQRFERLGTIDELADANKRWEVTADSYGAELNRWLEQIVGDGRSPADAFAEQYEDVTQ